MTTRTVAAELARQQAKAKREALEAALALQLKAERIPFESQALFWPGRCWRLDFLIGRHTRRPVAIEVQGGTWIGGAHSRGAGQERDCEKAAHAAMAGITLVPVTGGQIKSGAAIGWIRALVKS